MPDSLPTPADRRQLFYPGAVVVLTLLALGPIWAVEFPPLQDYPQHLFLAHANATFNDQAYNWSRYYQAELRPGPYTLFYYCIVWLETVMPVALAGKVFLTCYLALLAGCAVALSHRGPRAGTPPWGSLLVFPLAFHQIYFMGFTNYLLSLPLLVITVLDHQRLADGGGGTGAAVARQAVLIALLFLCHPYTILVYIVLAAAGAMVPGANGRRRGAALLPPLITAALFAGWYATTLPPNQGKMPLLWWPWPETLRYYLLMFTGMRWTDGIHWPTLAAWGAALALILFGAIRSIREGVALPKRTCLAFVLVTAGFFILPFWAGQYSYFNLRLAPISYLFAAILAGSCTLSPPAGLALASLAALLLGQSFVLQRAVAKETAQLKPILAVMAPNATVLPMTFDTGSNILDRHFFPEAHSHDHFYYHLLVGGGASPSLFPSPMLPLRFRPGVDLPLATHDFSWQAHGAKYDYILSRGGPEGFAPFVSRYATLAGQSGEWLLFRNEHHE